MNSVTVNERRNSVWNGALLMAAAMILSKMIGVLQKIPLQNLAGDRVFGIYNAVYPLYQMLLVAATAGLPPAVAIIVAKRLADGDRAGARSAKRAALWLLGLTGAAGFALMWLGAPAIAAAIGDEETAGAIRSIAFALWFVPALSALRGYSQGMNDMPASALSQVTEQVLRVAVMAGMLAWGMSNAWQDGDIAAGAMAGSAAGAAGAMALMAWRQRRQQLGSLQAAIAAVPAGAAVQGDSRQPITPRRLRLRQLVSEMGGLGKLAFPMAFGAAAVPLAAVVDAFMVPRLLSGSNLTDAEAMFQFGLYGRGQTLVQLVAMVSGAAASALVPSLALARRQNGWQEARLQASIAMRASWWIGAGSALGLALLARPINVMLFADDQATGTMALVGLTTLAAAVQTVSAAVLQGCGSVRLPALLLICAAALKALLNAVLVPAYGIDGAAAAGAIALTAAALAAAWAAQGALSGGDGP
ncbi:oligosaccharide flippase family protein, partial [Paenibacillus kobensis]|uniref:oligosaccharide flippase family protein n=1 Tax=Paenibacillus kobensis TaxID=59841 RepID=UPI000FDCC376